MRIIGYVSRKETKMRPFFQTRYDHYKYYVMPLGLANASATFQSYIYKCLAEKLDLFCIGYLDDMLIYKSEKEVKHDEAVR